MVNSTDHVNLLEIAWTVVGCLGVAANLYGLSDAFSDRAVIRALHSRKLYADGVTSTIANNHIRTEALRLVANCFVVTIGIEAMTIAPSPYPNTTIGWLFFILLFGIPLIFNANSIADRVMRHKIMKETIPSPAEVAKERDA